MRGQIKNRSVPYLSLTHCVTGVTTRLCSKTPSQKSRTWRRRWLTSGRTVTTIFSRTITFKIWYLQTLAPKPVHLAAEVSVQPWRWRKFYLLWQQQEQHHTLCRDLEQQGDVPCQLRLCKTGAWTAAGWMKDFHIQGVILTVPTKKFLSARINQNIQTVPMGTVLKYLSMEKVKIL